MALKTFIVVRLTFEGMHRWQKAPDAIGYLRARHRHVFHIEAEKTVVHSDRDVEFISFKHTLEEGLAVRFPCDSVTGIHDLGANSCEDVARFLLELFNLKRCVVYEDGENGGGVEDDGN